MDIIISQTFALLALRFPTIYITGTKEIAEFTVDQHAKGLGEVHLKLFALLKTICRNCGEPQPCLKDKTVAHHDLRKGLKVKKNNVRVRVCNYFNTAEGSKKVVAVVDSVLDPHEVVVRFGNPPNISNSQAQYFSSWTGVPTFCYKLKQA